ncbi:hypothetical protein TanjilG_17799 [Lupinus angustifolius]|uniref:Uncharacterized protein n=1 Tax=Lupinus angustifolius TaxID=3871 RepID=A0A4P1RTC4_LUPAN|nr:hypothetical protein TanjilG_17799 [Lupinus angustifolius]
MGFKLDEWDEGSSILTNKWVRTQSSFFFVRPHAFLVMLTASVVVGYGGYVWPSSIRSGREQPLNGLG